MIGVQRGEHRTPQLSRTADRLRVTVKGPQSRLHPRYTLCGTRELAVRDLVRSQMMPGGLDATRKLS
jgi:hypothetical protein